MARSSRDQQLDLWHEWQRTGDTAVRDRLVLTFAPLVKWIVFRKIRELPAHVEADDFLSAGIEALITSLDRFDPEKGATLEQFAWTRIHGAVLDELRRQDWAPRSVRRFDRAASKAAREFLSVHGREPTLEELAATLGVEEDVIRRHHADLVRSDVGSLNQTVAGDEGTTVERGDTLVSSDLDRDPEHQAMKSAAKARFRRAFANLNERERTIAVLLYVKDMTLWEVGEVLGVTESRVSQLHTGLRKKLRAELGEDADLFAAAA